MAEGVLQLDVASVVEDVLQQNGNRLNDIHLASRKAEEASLRRYDASGWLRKMVGVVGGITIPAQPSEEEFRLGLRSGIMLCNALNKVQPGAVPKVVEAPSDAILIPDGAALSAYQYFENVRNFLDSIGQMGIPGFEASDLEQGGKASRIVNCVLALKSYTEWKEGGGKGVWKFSGNMKPPSAGKQFVRKNTDLFINSLPKISAVGNRSPDSLSTDQDINGMSTSHSLQILVRELLSDKKREDIPVIVENMLSKVMEEFEYRLASQNEQQARTSFKHTASQDCRMHEETKTSSMMIKGDRRPTTDFHGYEPNGHASKQQDLVESQQRNIQGLKSSLHSTKEEMQLLLMKYQEEIIYLGKHLNGLAHAASGYQKVLEENRKLYNQVQDLKGNIRVYCRIRPFLPGQSSTTSTVEGVDEHTLAILAPSKYGKGKKSFTFNKVFVPSASQDEVFADTQPLIRSVLDGYNVCIFAYGQTGSGKTYTMTGPRELSKESLGVNYRALSDLFLFSEQRKESMVYDVAVQMIEIYNEQVRDLLVTDGLNKKLEIRNSSINGVNVPNANIVPVTSTSEVINLMNIGNKNRAVGSTAMNDRSSRSHSCLTVHVQGRDLATGSVLRGCMHLVDLAGSERADKSEAVGDRLKEAQHINRSLSALGDVISSLAQKNSHVPYRNSKLTQLLQDSLGGQAKTLMFVHISPEPDAVGETLSTLKFAERVSTVELGAARANKETADVKELKEQITSLKAALSRKERGESSAQQSMYLSPDRGWSSSSSTSRKQSFGTSDMMDSPPWTQLSSPHTRTMEEEHCISTDWVDTVMVNKQDREWNENGGNLPEMFYQEYDRDANKVYPEQSLCKISPHRKHSLDNGSAKKDQYEEATTDESDDLEAETSDSSEIDYQLQLSVTRSKSIPNGLGSKVVRPSLKQTKNTEMSSSLIPRPPTRRVPNGVHSPQYKHGRQPASVEVKRRPVGGK